MFKKIDKKAALDKLTDPKAVLVDIRDDESFKEGHLPQAIHLTNETIPDFLEKTDKDIPILVMCYHGNSSQSVAKYLADNGFSNVYSIDGGYEGWKEN